MSGCWSAIARLCELYLLRAIRHACPAPISCPLCYLLHPRPTQNLDKEKEEQRKLHSELAEQKKAVAAAEAEAEKVGAALRRLEWLIGQVLPHVTAAACWAPAS